MRWVCDEKVARQCGSDKQRRGGGITAQESQHTGLLAVRRYEGVGGRPAGVAGGEGGYTRLAASPASRRGDRAGGPRTVDGTAPAESRGFRFRPAEQAGPRAARPRSFSAPLIHAALRCSIPISSPFRFPPGLGRPCLLVVQCPAEGSSKGSLRVLQCGRAARPTQPQGKNVGRGRTNGATAKLAAERKKGGAGFRKILPAVAVARIKLTCSGGKFHVGM